MRSAEMPAPPKVSPHTNVPAHGRSFVPLSASTQPLTDNLRNEISALHLPEPHMPRVSSVTEYSYTRHSHLDANTRAHTRPTAPASHTFTDATHPERLHTHRRILMERPPYTFCGLGPSPENEHAHPDGGFKEDSAPLTVNVSHFQPRGAILLFMHRSKGVVPHEWWRYGARMEMKLRKSHESLAGEIDRFAHGNRS